MATAAVSLPGSFISCTGIMTFAHIWKPKVGKPEAGETWTPEQYESSKSWECGLIIDPLKDMVAEGRVTDAERFQQMTNNINAVKHLKWIETAPPTNKKLLLHMPMELGNDYNARMEATNKTVRPEYTDKVICSFRSKRPVGISKLVDGVTEPILNQNDLYSGCLVLVEYRVYAYDNQKLGIGFGLNCVALIEQRTPLVAMNDPDVAFRGIKVDTAAYKPVDNSHMFQQPTDSELGI